MNWLTNFVRPKIRALVGKPDIPDNLWLKCASCGAMLYQRDLEKSLFVCQHCGHHLRMRAKQRLAMLFDDGVFSLLPPPKVPLDPLKFRDGKRYIDRLKDAREKTGENDACAVAHGKLGGMPVVIAAFDFHFMGGSMGIAVGEALIAAAKLAVLQQAPLIVVPSSGGARMQEGILSLMQMPRTVIATQMLKEAGLPYIVVLTDPTTGGVSASFAMVADITISEPGAVIGFAGARVIEETIREKLPPEFQSAEYLRDHGMVDMVVARKELRETLTRLLGHLMRPNPPAEVIPFPAEPAAAAEAPAVPAPAR